MPQVGQRRSLADFFLVVDDVEAAGSDEVESLVAGDEFAGHGVGEDEIELFFSFWRRVLGGAGSTV
jgi:hypothetical protein